MSKFIAPLVTAACLLAFAAVPAQASSCVNSGPDPNQPGFDLQTCTLSEATSGDFFSVTNIFGATDWFDSWVILLEGNVNSDVLHFDPVGTLTLWSVGNAGFAAALASALASTDLLKVAENPVSGAATTFFVNYQSSLNGSTSGFGGCGLTTNGSCDTINVLSIEEGGGGQVPEPATLTLMGIGGLVAAIRRRKNGLARG